MLYEINKTTDIVVDTAIGNTSIQITEAVRQNSIFGLTMCCATTANVNDGKEKVDYKNGKMEIEMSIFKANISVAGDQRNLKKQ